MKTMTRLKKKMMWGISRKENATVTMVVVLVMAQVVVMSRRWRQTMIRPSSPR